MLNIQPNIAEKLQIKGIDIYFEYFGKKDSPVLVLLNGVAMETKSWYQFLPPLLEKVDVLLLDFRGQGQSTSDDDTYLVEDFADYVKAIIDHLSLAPKNVNICGISFGSAVVAEFLRKYASAVNKAVVSGIILSPERRYHYQAELGKNILQRGLIDLWVDSLYTALFSENFLVTIESFIPKLKEALNERYKNRKISLIRLLDAEEIYVENVKNYYSDFKKIETPILLIAGEHDIVTPIHVQQKAMRLFPNIKYIEHPEVGHTVFMERPKEFFGQILDFISR